MPQRNMPRPAAVYGIDIGKNIFHVVGVGSDGVPVQKVRFRRDTLLQFFERAAPAIVGMESCAGSQWIARKIQALGHKVRLIPAQFVKPYVKSNKSDIIDAEAIAEAATRPTMRFAALKSEEQAGNGRQFQKARDLAAWLGLMPREYSTGGKQKLLGISKRGNRYARKLLVHGARSCFRHLDRTRDRLGNWLDGLQARMHPNKAVVALAAKMARIVWVVLTKPGALYERRDPAFT